MSAQQSCSFFIVLHLFMANTGHPVTVPYESSVHTMSAGTMHIMCCTVIIHLCLCLPYMKPWGLIKSTVLDCSDTLYHINDKVGPYLIHMNLGLLDASVAWHCSKTIRICSWPGEIDLIYWFSRRIHPDLLWSMSASLHPTANITYVNDPTLLQGKICFNITLGSLTSHFIFKIKHIDVIIIL